MKKIDNSLNQDKNQFIDARCYWITGLSASGKSTMANMLTDYLIKKISQ